MNRLSETNKRTIIDLFLHCLSTIILVLIIVRASSSLLYGFVCILGGIFLDLDHLVDYYISAPKRFILKDFFMHKYLASGKIYLFLHAWEINLAVLIMAVFTGSVLSWVIFLSLSAHLLIDNFQRENAFFYFLTYRVSKGFNLGVMLPKTKARLLGE